MKKLVIVLLALLFVVSVALAAKPEKAEKPIDWQMKYNQERVASLNAQFQLFVGNLNNVATALENMQKAYPAQAKDIGAILKALVDSRNNALKKVQEEINALQKPEPAKVPKKEEGK